jgi:hypothetical protein
MGMIMTDFKLSSEKEELLARADELEAPIPGLPSDPPQAPCALPMAIAAAEQLDWSAENMRRYLGVGERERRRLAESLRNAAKAYEEVDENVAEAINTGTSVSAATVGLADEGLDAVTLNDTPVAVPIGAPEYGDFKTRAWELEKGDQGAAFHDFAEAWEAYRLALLDATARFRPFEYWDSAAADLVEANFEQHRSWLYRMADLCATMARQARDVVSAQRWAFTEHVWWDGGGTVTPRQLKFSDLEDMDYRYSTTYRNDAYLRDWYMKRYAELQQQSEEVMDGYAGQASLPLSAVNPLKPPTAHRIDPPGEKDGKGGDRDVADGWPSDEELPDPTGMPSVPSAGAPSAPDAALDAALTDAMAGAPGLPTGSGVKPASFGGGGVGGGLPSMPLQPPVDPESVSRAAAAARPVGLPGAGAMGGGGMGTAPMGAPGGGQGQGAGKSKRAKKDDESLYTEDRPWTGGVIGISPADGNPGSKDSK